MLASTVQFSSYDESPRIPHRQPPTRPHHGAPAERYDEHEALPRQPPTPTRGPARSLRTQQRAYNQPPPTTTFPTTPTGAAVLAAVTRSPAELVSVPPSSSTPDTRTHPEPGEHHGLGVTLDQPPGTTRT
jgi:hypothetical protein